MLGEKIGEESGKITGQRVLASSAGPTMEVSFTATGKLLGLDVQGNATYSATMRPDGSLYGEGQGIVMGKNGESATWTGGGVGRVGPNGTTIYRGAIYYQSAHPKLARLNGVCGVFEFETDAQGNAKGATWEWK